jgi:hypothetical protein
MEPGEEGTLGARATGLAERILERGDLNRAFLKVAGTITSKRLELRGFGSPLARCEGTRARQR